MSAAIVRKLTDCSHDARVSRFVDHKDNRAHAAHARSAFRKVVKGPEQRAKTLRLTQNLSLLEPRT